MVEPLIVKSWDEFFPQVKEAAKLLGNPACVWYRGQSNSDYSLLPSLYRTPRGPAVEQDVYMKFRDLAPRFLKEQSTEWNVLFDMQHYGVPTRLLDWTPVLGVAIFFALSYRSANDKDFSIYLLDPKGLNSMSGRPEIFSSKDPTFSYTSIYWKKQPFAPRHPIALESPFANDRMYAQQGCFTVHCDSPDPLETQGGNHVVKLQVSRECIPNAQEFLDYANINEVTMFPDIQGLTGYLRTFFFSR